MRKTAEAAPKKPAKEIIVIHDDEENERGNLPQGGMKIAEDKTEKTLISFDYSPSASRSALFKKSLGAAFGDSAVKASPPSSKGKKDGGGCTPLEKQVISLKNKHVECLLMVECGYKIKFFGEDALTAAKILKLWARKDHSFQTTWVPTHRFLVHARRLLAAGCRIGLVRQTETASIHKAASKTSGKMFERKCVAMYTPGTSIDEGDPVFSDLIKQSSSSSSSEEQEEGEAKERKIAAMIVMTLA